MRKVLITLMAILMLITFAPIKANADEINGQDNCDNSAFRIMFDKLYMSDSNDIDVTQNGISVKELFINATHSFYLRRDYQSIYNYMIENSILIIEGQSETAKLSSCENLRVITTAEYTSPGLYAVVYGTSPYNPNVQISLPIYYNIKVTVPYDFSTGLISGTLRSPRIVITSTDGVAESASASSVQYSVSITNGGYSVYYSNISFIVTGYYWPYDPQTYNRYYTSFTFTFTPAA